MSSLAKDNKKSGVRLKYRQEYPGKFKFDYKDPTTLGRFVMEGGKVVPARISKMSQAQQRTVTHAIKIARSLCLLPVATDHYDNWHGPEAISPQPFSY